MNHQEIRFRILHTLYQKFYEGQPVHHHNTDSVITESDLEGVSTDVAYADVIYLMKSGFIDGLAQLGVAHPTQIRITPKGIDAVESITEQALASLSSSDDPEVKEIVAEDNPPSRMRRLVNYIKQHPDFVVSTFEKIIKAVIGGSTGTPTT